MLPSGIVSFLSILIGIGVTLFSIYLTSGEWYSVVKRFEYLGIENADPNRKGRDSELTAKWLSEIKKARRSIVFSGVTLAGWFVSSWGDLCVALPEVLHHVNSFEIFVLNPLSEGLIVRDEDEKIAGEAREFASKRLVAVLTNLRNSMSSGTLADFWKNGKIQLYLYKGTPFSVMVIDDVIYSVTYLPCISDRECPQLKLSANGSYSEHIKLAIDRLRSNSATIRLTKPEEIDEAIRKYNSRIFGHMDNMEG